MFSTFIKKINIRLCWNLSLLLIIFLPWMLIFQWLNHIDEWFIITNFYYFFSSPESISYWFTHYLTDFIWNWFGNIFNWLWLLWFRIWWIFELYLIFIFSFLILKDYINKYIIFSWLLFAFLFTNNVDTINWVHYCYTTTLFYIIAIYFIYYGLIKKKHYFLFLAGITLWINTFVRLPNIIFIFCFLFIPFYFIFFQNDIKSNKLKLFKSISYILYYLIWFFSSILFVLFITKKIWHYWYLLNAFQLMSWMAKEWIETRNHWLSYLIFLYIKSFFFIFFISWFVWLFWYFSLFLKNKYKINFSLIYSVFLWIFLWIISICKTFFSFKVFWLNFFVSYVSFIFPFVIIVLFTYLLFSKQEKDKKFMVFIALIFLFTVQIWSWWYLELMQCAWFLCFPLLLHSLYNFNINRFIKKQTIIFLIIIILSSSISTIFMLYYNNRNIFEINNLKIYKLWYLNLSRNFQNEIIQIWDFINKNKWKKLLYLSNFWQWSYFYYIYDVKPYLWNSVPAYYPLDNYIALLDKKIIIDYPLLVEYKYKNIKNDNEFRIVWENFKKVTFDMINKKWINIIKTYETENYVFYTLYK